jgi:hypothetical protein
MTSLVAAAQWPAAVKISMMTRVEAEVGCCALKFGYRAMTFNFIRLTSENFDGSTLISVKNDSLTIQQMNSSF